MYGLKRTFAVSFVSDELIPHIRVYISLLHN